VSAGVRDASGHALYRRLIAVLEQHQARFRLIDHAPEGRTDVVSRMRGNALERAAKCLVLLVKLDKKTKRFALAVVPGDRQVDFAAVKRLLGASWVGFAQQDVAERLAGSPAGTVLPFAFAPELELIADPAVLDGGEIYFNAARLDRSLALATGDWQRIAAPRLAAIAGPSVATNGSAPAYDISLDVAFGALETIDIAALAGACTSDWYNQTLTRVNDCVVRLGVLEGDFHWHKHDDQDEFFYVVEGRWVIELPERTVELGPGQAFTVPRGVMHFPRAPECTVLLMIEGAGVTPAGD
jgi:Ala-tRNA(Pro) deacylase